jgi:hypothetical protein
MTDSPSAKTSLAGLGRGLESFLSAPASARPLAVLRIGLAAVLLLQAWAVWGSIEELYGSLGLVQQPIIDALVPTGVPRASWLGEALAPLGITEAASLNGLFLAYVLSLLALLLGWHTRTAAVLAWLTHLMFKASGFATSYGALEFAHIGLFYCMLMPVGHALSLDRRAGRTPAGPTAGARLSLRVLQLHLCVVYLSSGFWKATGEQWWSGEAVWRALMRPDLAQMDFSWLAQVPWLAALACWGTLAIELGYPMFIWHRRTRVPMALATLGLHAGIAAALGLLSFSALMALLTIAAFLVSAEPRTEAVDAHAEPASDQARLSPVHLR